MPKLCILQIQLFLSKGSKMFLFQYLQLVPSILKLQLTGSLIFKTYMVIKFSKVLTNSAHTRTRKYSNINCAKYRIWLSSLLRFIYVALFLMSVKIYQNCLTRKRIGYNHEIHVHCLENYAINRFLHFFLN